MPKIDPDNGKSTKCIACGACVAGCPTSALKIVLWDEIAAAL
jgi:ferredoxin